MLEDIRMVPVSREDYKFGLWVSGQVVAIYFEYDAAIEAMEYLYGQGFDLAIVNVDTHETLYTANWGDGGRGSRAGEFRAETVLILQKPLR